MIYSMGYFILWMMPLLAQAVSYLAAFARLSSYLNTFPHRVHSVLVNFCTALDSIAMENFTSLQEYLMLEDWLDRFDEDLLGIGKKLSRDKKIHDLAAEQSDAQSVTVTASCLAKPEVRLEINFWMFAGEWDMDTSCSCHVAHFCEHAAAVLFVLSQQENLARLLAGQSLSSRLTQSLTPASSLLSESASEIPTLIASPTFRVDVSREPVEGRNANAVCQYLGEKNPTEWVIARAMARYGDHDLPLYGMTPPQDVLIKDAQGNPLLIRRDRAAEIVASSLLREIGLTAIDSSPMLRFLHGSQKLVSTVDNPWLPSLPPWQVPSVPGASPSGRVHASSPSWRRMTVCSPSRWNRVRFSPHPLLSRPCTRSQHSSHWWEHRCSTQAWCATSRISGAVARPRS